MIQNGEKWRRVIVKKKPASHTMNEMEPKTRRVLVYVLSTQVVLSSCVRDMVFTMIAGEHRHMILINRLHKSIGKGNVNDIRQVLRDLSVAMLWPSFHKLVAKIRKFRLLHHVHFWKEHRTSDKLAFKNMLMNIRTDLPLDKKSHVWGA